MSDKRKFVSTLEEDCQIGEWSLRPFRPATCRLNSFVKTKGLRNGLPTTGEKILWQSPSEVSVSEEGILPSENAPSGSSPIFAQISHLSAASPSM